MAIQGTDIIQVESGGTQYKDTAANIKTGTKSYDHLLVRRGGTDYKLEKERRYNVEYTDKLLVNRSGTNYTETGENYLDYMWSYGVSSRKGVGQVSTVYGARVVARDGIVAIGNRSFSSSTGRVDVWGLDGSTKYSKTGPSNSSSFGYAVDAGQGKLVVGAFGAKTVYVYDLETGNLQTTISQPSITNFGVWVAIGDGIIAIVEDGSTNSGVANGSCYIYDLNGNYITRIFPPDPYGSSRLSMASIGSGKLVIGMYTQGGSSSNNGALHIYNASTRAFETTIIGSSNDRLSSVSSTDEYKVSLESDLIVAGTANNVVRVYNLSGSLQYSIPKPGAAQANLWGKSVVVGAGRIFALDTRNNNNGATRVNYIYDLDGNFLTSVTLTGNGNGYSSVDVDSGLGYCVVTDIATPSDGGGFRTIGNTNV